MGGRGSSSGLSAGGASGISVKRDGETTHYYFSSRNGVNYYQRGIGGTPEPTPQNISAKEFQRRVEKSGASVKNISAKDKAKMERSHTEDRAKTNEFLNQSDTQIGGNRTGQRRATKGRRGARRGI